MEVWDSSVEGGGELESLFFLAFQRLRGGLGGTTPLDNSRKRVSANLEDRVLWKKTKCEIFFC